jgi:type IV secretion system protein TrbL
MHGERGRQPFGIKPAAEAAFGLGRAGFAAGMSALRAGTSVASATTSAFSLGAATSGKTGIGGVAAGIGGIGRAGAGAAGNAARSVGNRIAGAVRQDVAAGRSAAWRATGGGNASARAASSSPVAAAGGDTAPDWARRLRAEQSRRAHMHSTAQAVKDGDRPTGEAHPDLEEKDE